ncbi:helix-turn-helix domain-containing protein [Paenibacillus sp. J5C_2022]|uniref:helix-turn-helix domain-containing protein n=1 Tax=Paenibacillus sp. J5C2022 TaxID=2977129 RepID=UPI0021D16381|nr:helix-turn-helix transcriptional regulator [Paenibacillus sp. J5C2022]MCU6712429.1 helix-turn-helix domain-containing protein [Paenibacillus sp. J5C2022]
MSDISRLIGENIRALRREKGLSQEQLALRADINTSYMGQVERGEKNPTIDVLNRIAFALQTPLKDIVTVEALGEEDEASKSNQDSSLYAEKIAHQLTVLSLKEQEVVYKLVKQLVHFREMD